MDLNGHTAVDGAGTPTLLDVDLPELRRLGIELESTADEIRTAVPGTPHLLASPAGWAVTAALTGWTAAAASRLATVADGLENIGAGMRRAAATLDRADLLLLPDPARGQGGGR
jgi:hypothetical protein